MLHGVLSDSRFFSALTKFDEDLAVEVRAAGCGGRLHSARYPRKPRGGPADLGAEYGWRLSFCCAEEGCRQWWRSVFVCSACWRGARGRFVPPVEENALPHALLARFAGTAAERVLATLRMLSPLTTTSAKRRLSAAR